MACEALNGCPGMLGVRREVTWAGDSASGAPAASYERPDGGVWLDAVERAVREHGRARLGIMGGTFDPVHEGHLACAEMARDACGLDHVAFMVAPRPWMKQGRRMADVHSRVEMCQLAVEGNDVFSVSTLEAARSGATYTSDTLRALRGMIPEEAGLFFVAGADILETLLGWHDTDALRELATFVCVSRPGQPNAMRLLERVREAGFRVEWVDAPSLDISSSEVRSRVREGRTVRYLVPDAVLEYIERERPYGGGEDD